MRKIMIPLVVILMILTAAPAMASVLVLPESAAAIEAEAFAGDTSLDRVVLPEQIKTIGSLAFANSSLTSVNLPLGIEYIADNAFENCEKVQAIVTEESYAHEWCVTNKVDCTVLPPYTYQVDETGVLITGYTGKRTEIEIPAEIEGKPVVTLKLGNNSLVQSIKLPETITYLSRGALSGCANLQSVWFGAGVAFIDEDAFDGAWPRVYCSAGSSTAYAVTEQGKAFWTADSDMKLRQYRDEDGNPYLELAEMFVGDVSTGLPQVTLPERIQDVPLTHIGSEAFVYHGKKNVALTLHDRVSCIHPNAFDSVATQVVFVCNAGSSAADLLTEMGYEFYVEYFGDKALRQYRDEDGNPCLELASYSTSNTSITIPEAVQGVPITRIGRGAFYKCYELYLPDQITYIARDVFESYMPTIYCNAGSRTADVITENNYSFRDPGEEYRYLGLMQRRDESGSLYLELTYYGAYADQITIPENVDGIPLSSIGAYAFYNCSVLTLPGNLILIDHRAFDDSPSITLYCPADSVTAALLVSIGQPFTPIHQ